MRASAKMTQFSMSPWNRVGPNRSRYIEKNKLDMTVVGKSDLSHLSKRLLEQSARNVPGRSNGQG